MDRSICYPTNSWELGTGFPLLGLRGIANGGFPEMQRLGHSMYPLFRILDLDFS